VSGLTFAALVLAAGKSTRMGGANKLTAEIGGKSVVRRAVEAALDSRARPVAVITGHERDQVEAALAGLDVRFVHNAFYAEGMASSLKAGLAVLPSETEAVAILLGDMPRVTGKLIDQLAEALAPKAGKLIAIPVRQGRQGNPVLFARALFSELNKLEGDRGAKALIEAHHAIVVEVATEDDGAFLDVDTPTALANLRQSGA
jgi:molybdenum cofactor cytidylyltransferase